MTLADLVSAWPVLASLAGAVAVSAVAVSRASAAVETAKAQAMEIVALREAAAATKVSMEANALDHQRILAQLERLQDSVDRLAQRPGR